MKVKKLLLILALFIIINIVYSVNSYGATGKVTGNGVRLRDGASTNSKIITNLYEDDKVTVLEKSGEWYKIKFDEYEGYIYEDYLKVNGEVKESAKTEEKPKKEEETTKPEQPKEETKPVSSTSVASIEVGNTYKVNNNSKLYIIPVVYSSIIDNLKSGESVTVIQIVNNWVYVETDTITGWIIKSAIEQNTEPEPEPEPEAQEPEQKQEEKEEKKSEEKEEPTTQTKKVGYVNVENANVREDATVDAEHIITITLNTELTILGEKNGWYNIEVNGINGYINKKLVSDKKTESSTSRSKTEPRNTPENTNTEENKTQDKEEQKTEESAEKTEATTPKIEDSTSKGTEIVQFAKTFLGGKYVSGGNNPSTGVDCSGFTKYVFAHFGYNLSRTATAQASNGKEVERSKMQEGDIIIFLNESKSKIGHVGIYIGNDKFIHAANAKRGIVIDSVYSSYYNPRFVCARRII